MFENKTWSQTELHLSNKVSNRMIVMHLDRQLSVILRIKTLVLNEITLHLAEKM